MAITTKLELRQGQSLVMTPLLQQAIKLLQLSHVELQSFVEAELERNPLLERADPDEPAASGDLGLGSAPGMKDEPDGQSSAQETDAGEGDEGEWIDLESDASRSEDLDVEPQDAFPDADAAAFAGATGLGPAAFGQSGGAASGDAPNLEAYVAGERTLKDHLTEQLILAFADPAHRLIGHHLIDMTDEAGYLSGDLAGGAELLGAPLALVEETLRVMQGFDPSGVFARDLRECLMLQLKEQDRCDPAMAALIENINLLDVHVLPSLKRASKVSD